MISPSNGNGETIMAETIAWILKGKSDEIWSVAPDVTVYDALALMAEKSVGALLVVENGALVGIVSERDYARKIVLHGRSSRDTLVEEVMTRDPITVTPDHTVDECMRIITHNRIRHLPVMEHHQIVGVVSIGDLVNAIISDQAHTIDQLHTYIGSKYPA
jgi:CBS domain-containing protein